MCVSEKFWELFAELNTAQLKALTRQAHLVTSLFIFLTCFAVAAGFAYFRQLASFYRFVTVAYSFCPVEYKFRLLGSQTILNLIIYLENNNNIYIIK